MPIGSRSVLARLVGALMLPAIAAAGEPGPGEPEQDPHRMHMEQLADLEAHGKLPPEQAREINRYWATHLRRGPMNAIESAHYSIAEIHLKRGKANEAIAALEKVLAATADADLKSLTHLNLAEVYRRQLEDATQAIEHYKQVAGPLRHRAQAYMIAMLAATGKAERAAKITEGLIAAAKETGEKLALLQRLAAIYEKAKMPDKAIAAYQRITTEFTPRDLAEMTQAVVLEVKTTIQKAIEARQNNQWEEAERLQQQLHRRAQTLRMAGRWDEFKAFERAARQGFQRLHFPHPPPPPPEPPAPGPQPGKEREGEF